MPVVEDAQCKNMWWGNCQICRLKLQLLVIIVEGQGQTSEQKVQNRKQRLEKHESSSAEAVKRLKTPMTGISNERTQKTLGGK